MVTSFSGIVDGISLQPEKMPAEDVIVKGFFKPQGDLNDDQTVNVSDVVTLITYITKNDFSAVDKNSLDLNGDGKLDVTDVVTLILIIAN